MTWTATDRRRIQDRRYRKTRALKLLRGEPTSLTDATDAAAHIRAMFDLGWSFNALEQMAGGAVSSVTLNNLADARHPTVERNTHAAATSIPWTLAPTPLVDDTAHVPTIGAARRVHALMRLGWPHAELRARGIESSHLSRGTYRQMTAGKWRKVDAVYRELCMSVGPSTTTATRARAAGHASPLAWDDHIDVPDARPVGATKPGTDKAIDHVVVARLVAGERVPSTPAEKREAMRRWVADGKSARSLAVMHGWNDMRYVTKGGAA